LYALKPVVIAIVVQAIWKLGQTAVKTKWLALVALLAAALYAVRTHEILILLIAAGLGAAPMIYRGLRRQSPAVLLTPAHIFGAFAPARAPVEPWRPFLVFSNVGAVPLSD